MNYQSIFFGCFLLIAFVSTVIAQKNKGELNIWTTNIVQRNYDNLEGCLSKVRIAKNKSFDRISFEFDGELNSYTIHYLPSNKYAEGEKIRIAGKVFMQINLYATPCENENHPEGKLKFPMIQQMTGGVFEGMQDYVVGVKTKTLYRVLELSNPSRLVIDFKH